MIFTVQQILNFRKYLRVQMNGDYNMFDPRARAATGISREDYIFVMEHYSELKAQYDLQESE